MKKEERNTYQTARELSKMKIISKYDGGEFTKRMNKFTEDNMQGSGFEQVGKNYFVLKRTKNKKDKDE